MILSSSQLRLRHQHVPLERSDVRLGFPELLLELVHLPTVGLALGTESTIALSKVVELIDLIQEFGMLSGSLYCAR